MLLSVFLVNRSQVISCTKFYLEFNITLIKSNRLANIVTSTHGSNSKQNTILRVSYALCMPLCVCVRNAIPLWVVSINAAISNWFCNIFLMSAIFSIKFILLFYTKSTTINCIERVSDWFCSNWSNICWHKIKKTMIFGEPSLVL